MILPLLGGVTGSMAGFSLTGVMLYQVCRFLCWESLFILGFLSSYGLMCEQKPQVWLLKHTTYTMLKVKIILKFVWSPFSNYIKDNFNVLMLFVLYCFFFYYSVGEEKVGKLYFWPLICLNLNAFLNLCHCKHGLLGISDYLCLILHAFWDWEIFHKCLFPSFSH